MLDCQGFEFGVALLLYHLSRLGTEGLNPVRVELILDDKDKKTAGQLIHMLKKHAQVSESIELALAEALAARNRLMHRVLIDNVESLVTEEGRSSLVKEIRSLRSKVRKADKKLQPFIMAFNESIGLDMDELEKEVRGKLS